MASQSPAVSVIIPAYRSWDALPRCLTALERQEGEIPFEIIVVASGIADNTPPLTGRFPTVRFLVFAERKFPGIARNLGASQARGEILLFVDADCALAPNGVQRVAASHRRHASPLIGGAIDQGEAANGVAWSHYFSSFSPWMPRRRQEPAVTNDVAAGCCSIKRWAFERFGPFSERRYCEDTLLSWRIGQAGYPVLFDPGIQVRHNGIATLACLLGRKFRHGRAFAGMRAQEKGWGLVRRLLQIAGAPLVPWLMLWRCGRKVFRAGVHRRRFLLVMPVTFAALLAWVAGELCGLLSTAPPRPD
jgi:GT2 family glycosyltransferase